MARVSTLLATAFSTALGAALAISSVVPALSADYLERAPSQTYDDTCGRSGVLNRIASRFSYQVHHVPGLQQVAIQDFSEVHQQRYEPSRDPEMSAVSRYYCQATAHLSDGNQRPVWYVVEEGMGFASIGNNVEFCVAGFDRWNVYNGSCRSLK
ncbi:hypothetical protein AB4Y96_25705 [Phyllobacterium sp. TAF24]|uniref:hypothetical protein n=1 Tax=unclassified Phyllobacterium TaxID=2638441 RepID=UPI00088BE767|nr:hypothetical protein [Phyllobacterium sp. OV277]SDO96090.1 hypothetical protein SAMN05443582_10318 [Phyllobacterium sp. OV277]